MSKQSWIGQMLGGRYEILELLGQGGMSAVYKANDPNLRRVVAVKMIHPHLSSNPEFVRRFEEEAAAVASLRHPNIIQVYDFSRDGETFYIIFEFIPGESLQAYLKRLNENERLMPYTQTVSIAASISEALDYAHERGMIHRDIKPANVMLNVQGQAILMDFGVVKIVGGDTHTATGAVVGTARYMSPEQIRGEKVDTRSDIYSLGVTLFEMVGARPPFQADSALTVMMMHVNDPVPDLRTIRPDVPEDLVSIINKALAKDRGTRYQTAGELASDLRSARLEPPADKSTVIVPPAVVASSQIATKPESPVTSSQGVPTPVSAPRPSTMVAAPATGAYSGQSASISSAAASAASVTSGRKSGRNNTLIFGGIAAVVLIFICIIGAAILFGSGVLFGGDNGDPVGTETADAALIQTQEAEATELAGIIQTTTAAPTIEAGPIEPSPTATFASVETPTTAAIPTTAGTPTIDATETSTAMPSATHTPPPTEAPPTETPTEPAGPQIRINNITSDGTSYIVDYTPIGYQPALPGVHIHFFWNTVPPQNAGVGPTQESWILYGGPNPFSQYRVSDRPAGATQMCALVANPDHTIQLNTGNCVNLP